MCCGSDDGGDGGGLGHGCIYEAVKQASRWWWCEYSLDRH